MSKSISFVAVLVAATFISCKNEKKEPAPEKTDTVVTTPSKLPKDNQSADKEQITQLIRRTLVWADGKAPDLLPALENPGDTVSTGIDFKKQVVNLNILKASGFFSKEFVDNASNIAKTIDKNLKAGKYGVWDTREIPPFNIYNDVNPWCNCQDNFEWDEVETEVISLDDNKGELKWKFRTSPNDDQSWKDFSYKFRVVKDGGEWKISYMEGFDYNEATKVF
ncbi:hypothetical protein ACLI08_06090 [Flavobacterium sp. RNTU_13]|uniref:hypothetical protein n=1 Tax=Flavobacterium sp. RNTU_13 TaxID=3375145 RepID=UPI0039887A39